MEEQIIEMKSITMRGMLALINTIHAIDDQSKKMVFEIIDYISSLPTLFSYAAL